MQKTEKKTLEAYAASVRCPTCHRQMEWMGQLIVDPKLSLCEPAVFCSYAKCENSLTAYKPPTVTLERIEIPTEETVSK